MSLQKEDNQTKRYKLFLDDNTCRITDDCLFEIFLNLDAKEIKNVASSCKRFAKICNVNLWRKICTYRWGIKV
jgi:hypothetical protein